MRRYDFIVVGSGPGAAAWVRGCLRRAPRSRILLLERGPFCKTDVLTERNPLTLLRDSRRVVAGYAHEVKQGRTLGGGTAVNNYAFTMPAWSDLRKSLRIERDGESEAVVEDFEEMCEELIGPRQPPHLLHHLLTASLPAEVELASNAQLRVRPTNRNAVFLGAPTLNSDGERRSAFTGALNRWWPLQTNENVCSLSVHVLSGIIEPLWREHFRNLHVLTDTEVSRVLFTQEDGREPAVTGVQTIDGFVFHAPTVVVGGGCLETPAVLMRSGIGPAAHLQGRGVSAATVGLG